jgi:hypothetical protein
MPKRVKTVLLILATLALSVCTREPFVRRSMSEAAASYSDAFAYCRAVGTVDAPDARFTGAKMPQAVARGLMRATGAPAAAPLDLFVSNSFWRCMNGKVYACTVGANLPCQEKADTRQTATSGMLGFCSDDPNAEIIPAVATGRATVYLWRCSSGTPTVVRQVSQADARGFIANIWYEIPPGVG